MTLNKQISSGLKWQALNVAGKQILSLFVFTALARLLDPETFGVVALIGVYLGVVTMFVDQGIGKALIQRQNLLPGHKHAAFWFNLGCAVALCLGTLVVAGPVAEFFEEPALVGPLRWASLGLVIGALSEIHATLFVKEMDFRRPLIRNLLANAAGGIVGVGMALAGFGVWSLVGQQLAGAVAGAIFLWTVSPYRPAFQFSFAHLRDLFGMSFSVFFTSLLWYLTSRLDQIVIGRFASTPILGLYAIANKFPDFAKTLAITPVSEVSFPALSQIQDDHARMRQVVIRGMELNTFLAFPLYVGLAMVAPDLLPCLLGAKWASAAGLCSLLSLYALVITLQVFFVPTLLATGGARKYVTLSVIQAVAALVGCLVGIHFGIQYLVLGLIGSALLISFPALVFLRERITLSPFSYCRPCLAPALASVLMAGMIWLVARGLPAGTMSGLELACKVVTGAAAYLGGMCLIAPARLTLFVKTIRQTLGQSQVQTSEADTKPASGQSATGRPPGPFTEIPGIVTQSPEEPRFKRPRSPIPAVPGAPFVSVIVATFNRCKLLANLLDALARQTLNRTAFEVIIVNDGSTDGTAEMLARRQQTLTNLKMLNLKNCGPAVARNAGTRLARGRYLAFTDDDCLPHLDWLAQLLSMFERTGSVAVQGKTTTDRAARTPLTHDMEVLGLQLETMPTCNVAYLKSAFDAAGGFDEGFPFPHNEDADLAWRIQDLGPVVFAPEMQVFHPPRPESFGKIVSNTRMFESDFLLYYNARAKYRKYRACSPWCIIYWQVFVVDHLRFVKSCGKYLLWFWRPRLFLIGIALVVARSFNLFRLFPTFYRAQKIYRNVVANRHPNGLNYADGKKPYFHPVMTQPQQNN